MNTKITKVDNGWKVEGQVLIWPESTGIKELDALNKWTNEVGRANEVGKITEVPSWINTEVVFNKKEDMLKYLEEVL